MASESSTPTPKKEPVTPASTASGTETVAPASKKEPATPASAERGVETAAPASKKEPVAPASTARGGETAAPASKKEPATPTSTARGAETAAPASKKEPVAATSSAHGAETAAPVPAQPPSPSEPTKTARVQKPKTKKEGEPAKVSLSLDSGEVEKPKIIKAKGSKNVATGVAHVLATFNNTIVSITDLNGNVIGWSSAGKVGFKGSRKSTAYAAQLVAQDACRQAMGHGLKEVEVLVKGPGAGRESAVRAIQAIGLDISVIRDVTPVPHNGCRPPKQRRV